MLKKDGQESFEVFKIQAKSYFYNVFEVFLNQLKRSIFIYFKSNSRVLIG